MISVATEVNPKRPGAGPFSYSNAVFVEHAERRVYRQLSKLRTEENALRRYREIWGARAGKHRKRSVMSLCC